MNPFFKNSEKKFYCIKATFCPRNYSMYQKRAAKLVIKLKNKSYIDRLIYLNMPTLKYRRLRGDMIEVFKITHNIYDRTVSPDLPLNERANTKGNHKLQNRTFHYDLRKHFFLHAL